MPVQSAASGNYQRLGAFGDAVPGTGALRPQFESTPLPGYFIGKSVPQTSKSAVSRVSKPADAAHSRRPANLEIGDTAGLEICGTQVSPASANPTVKYPG